MGFLEDWRLSYEDINELLTDNPSLRSFVSGYAAEVKLRRMWFESDSRVTDVIKYDDHDRTKKGDIAFRYRGRMFKLEVKSLQTNSIRITGGPKTARFQCDASDKRPVVFPDRTTVATTCLLVGEFDLLAVNLFGFHGDWVFAFAKNGDLPRVKGNRGAAKLYSDYQRSKLLATLMHISDPIAAPYRLEPWSLLDELIEERDLGTAPSAPSVLSRKGGNQQVEQDTLFIPPEP